MEKEIILQTHELKKYFGKVHAVNGVSISVYHGQVYGFLGPNGSGKTTTIGMILGLLHPTSGRVTLFGEMITPNHTKPLRRVGALVGAPSLLPYLSARQNLELLGRVSQEVGQARIDEVLEIVGLSQVARRLVRFGFEDMAAEKIWAGVALWNQASRRVLEKIGLGYVRNNPAGYQINGEPVETREYEVDREKWSVRDGAQE
jgi:ABC-type Na+ transport system ATPase subunit NatA